MAKQTPNDSNFELKECFIITPIGDSKSIVREKATGLITSVITPVLLAAGYHPIAAHNLPDSGSVNHQIINKILDCELVIANLTGLNPNVMYELAIRHAARLPVITMMERGDTSGLPFDLVDQRTIFYDDTLMGSEQAKKDLTAFVESALKTDKPNNPIYAATTQKTVFKELDKGDPLKIIMEKIDYLSTRINSSIGTPPAYIDQATRFGRNGVLRFQLFNSNNEKIVHYDDPEITIIFNAIEKIASEINELGNLEFEFDSPLCTLRFNFRGSNTIKVFADKVNQIQGVRF